MKCDELKVYTNPTYGSEYYDIDEVDAAIAELKARIQLDDDEMAGFLDLEEECGGGDLRNYIAELKQKLSEKDKEIESLNASHYAEMVDAGMENHILRRKLCLLRAEYAESRFVAFDNLNMTYRKDYVEERCGFWLKVKEYWQAKAEEYR